VSDTVESNPKAALGYRLSLAAVIFFGVLIVVGVGILIVGLMQGWGSNAKPPAGGEAGKARFHVAGARVQDFEQRYPTRQASSRTSRDR